MRGPYTKLHVHFAWATWDRLPLITARLKEPLMASIEAKCGELGATPLAIGLMPDHVHLLVRFPPALAIAVLAKEVKGASSHLMTHVVAAGEWFKWQGGYGAFTVSADDLPVVRAYPSAMYDVACSCLVW